MEEFHNLIVSYNNQKETAKKIGSIEIRAEGALNEGLNLTYNILCEIEAKHNVKGRNYESPKDLLRDLHTYKCCSVENGRRNLSFITAELAGIIVTKLVEIHEMCKQTSESSELLIETDLSMCSCNQMNFRKELDDLIDILMQLKSVDRLQVSTFVSCVIDLRLPVVILSALQKTNLVPISIYVIHIVNRKDMLHHLIRDLISHLGKSHGHDDDSSFKLCDASVQLLATLLQLGLGEEIAEPGHATWHLCNQACHDFVKQFLSEITNCVLSNGDGVFLGKHFLQLCEQKWHVGEKALQEYLLLNLQSLAIGPKVSTDHALALQQQWLHVEVEQTLKIYLDNLLSAMGQEAAHTGILSMVDDKSCNWQSILFFITAFLTNFPGAAVALKAFVDGYLARALTKHSRSLLACTFLIVRQACFITGVSHIQSAFPSYGAWFGSAFGAEAGSVQTSTTPTSFTFLMNFLSDLVPTDPPFCLRVHINKVPSAPAQCSHLLADFVSLAKTRLKDLGEVTGSGLFAFENTPDQDVAAALLHFEKSKGQISRVLLDSSKFRRTQYERQFLPVLLVPEPNCEQRTSRQSLIIKLQAAGKIPSTMLQQYERACQHLSSQHSGQRKIGPISGTPIERWQAVLEILVSTLRDNGVDEIGSLTREGESAFSAVGAQLEPLLRWAAEQSDAGTILRKVMGRLLKACELCFEPPTPHGIRRSSVWLHRIVTLLNSQPSLLRQFQGAVFHIACNIALPPHVTEAAAALACVLDYRKEDSGSFRSTVPAESDKLGETIGRALHLTSEKRMLHALVFCSTYLQRIDEVSGGIPPSPWCTPSPLRVLLYLRDRLLYSSVQNVLNACAQSWSPPSSWTILVTEAQLSLAEWLELEAAVDHSEDPLKIRHMYLCGWIMQHCDHCAATELLTASLTYAAKGFDSWGNELRHTIPSIVLPSKSDTETVPWLLETWSDISSRFSYHIILKAVQSLPPWMLLTNTLGVIPTSDSISALANLISTHMDVMSDKSFLFLNVVALVIGAVRAAAPLSRGEILSQILEASPALYVSLLRHGLQLQQQLVPSFSASCSVGCSLERITMIIMAGADQQQVSTGCLSWEVGLANWSQGAPLPKAEDGSLFFHLMELGSKLLQGSLSMAMVTQGPVLPSSLPMGSLLFRQPFYCLKMLRDGTKIQPLCLPSIGITLHGRAGLSLATIGVILSLESDQLPHHGEDTARICSQVLQQCLCLWKEVCREIDPCDSRVKEVSFVQWLSRRTQSVIENFQVQ